jgi:signal transduction histidine kinase
MNGNQSKLEDTGLEVLDLDGDSAFAERRLHVRDIATQMEGMRRLVRAFVENPDTVLQELVNAAVDMCGADSAGISTENKDGNGETFYEWVATAGSYAHFLNAILPSHPSACGVCLERARPQLFRVSKVFFDLMGIEAETVTDGLLIPWQVDELRGTIWIMAHGRHEAFDGEDSRLMQVLADFAAMAVRQQRQQKMLMKQATAAAAAAMANELAHSINNPLQSLTNLVYLTIEGQSGDDSKALAQEMSGNLERLSALVKKLLELPVDMVRRG